MLKSRLVHLSAFALVASATAALSTPLLAQGTMRLAFGYQCGDNFVVHNDGAQPVDLQYAVAGSRDQAPLHLNGGESLTITSPANDPLQLWVNGKVVATEQKGNRACAPSSGNSNVIVRPLNPGDGAAQPPATTDANAAPLPDGPPAYDYYPPYPYPYYYSYYPYAYYGGYPYLYGGPLISIRSGPVFGGFPRGGVIGRGGRGRGR